MAESETAKTYPRTVRFGDLEVSFRLMTASDRAMMLGFARFLPEEDLLFLRTDITREDVIDVWLRDISDGHTTSLLAEAQGKLVGYGSLHHSESLWTRHLGEILLLVGNAYRSTGIGGHLARQILELAKGHDHLQKLVAQMMSTQRAAQGLFHQLGFIPEAMLHDWVIDRNGTTHNLIMMSREVDLEEDFLADAAGTTRAIS